MNTGDIARKLIHMLDLLGASAGIMHGLGHRTDLLPLVIRKGCRVQPPEALLFVLDGSPVIAWSICRIKLVAQHGGNRVFVEESGTQALAAGPMALPIPRIGYFVHPHPRHAQ